jgi:hypothetical protein
MIESIMRYDLKPMIERCKKEHDYTDEDMVILEKELKRYFIISELNRSEETKSGFGMFSRDVDKLWHAFILFTQDYAQFCTTCVNHFIHHNPKTEIDRSPEKKQQSRENFLEFVKLYEETFQEEIHPIWLLDMCERQTEEQTESIT